MRTQYYEVTLEVSADLPLGLVEEALWRALDWTKSGLDCADLRIKHTGEDDPVIGGPASGPGGAAVKPYFEDDAVTIYHGDCRDVLPELGPVDLVLTDPPWPMQVKEVMVGNADALALWRDVVPLLHAKRLLVWHAIHNDPRDYLNPLKDWPYLRAIYLRRAIPGYFGRVLMDGELIHALGEWPPAKKGRMVMPGGMQITYVASDRLNGHPGPRSLIATRWLVKFWSDEGETILDPFMGSGTTLRAAKDLGRKAIGIEIEEKYCEIAAKRMQQATLPLSVPEPEPERGVLL